MKINEHTVRFGSGACVFDFWAWRSTFPEPMVDTVPVEKKTNKQKNKKGRE